MRKAHLVALATGALIAAGIAVPSTASADTESEQQQHCAAEFHAAVLEDNEAYNSRDAARYEAILNPRMIFWYDGNATYGRDAIMANARRDFTVPGWVWTATIKSETVYGCSSGIAVAEAHSINAAAGTDVHFAFTMGLVREGGKWSVAIDNVHRLPA